MLSGSLARHTDIPVTGWGAELARRHSALTAPYQLSPNPLLERQAARE